MKIPRGLIRSDKKGEKMMTWADVCVELGNCDKSSATSYVGKSSGISEASSARSKTRISKDEALIAGGKSMGSNDGGETSTIAGDDDDDGGDNDADPDRRRPRKNTPRRIEPALFAFAPLSQYIGFGRSRIYQLILEGKFPSPIKVGKSSRWVRAEIDQWLAQQIAARPHSYSGVAI